MICTPISCRGSGRWLALTLLVLLLFAPKRATPVPLGDPVAGSALSPGQMSDAVVSIGVLALDPPGSADPGDAPGNKERFATLNGTGFFVSQDGDVLTALHVVRAAERARDEMAGTDNRLFIGLPVERTFAAREAEVVDVDEAHDLALLRPKQPLRVRAVFRFSPTEPEVGALVEAAGLPASTAASLVFNTGHMADVSLMRPGNQVVKFSAASRLEGVQEFYLVDMKADEGMSGGPVYLVETGAVIGVVHGYTQDPRRAVVVPAYYGMELMKHNSVPFQSFPGSQP